MVDGTVEIRLAEYFERPLRLTPAEGLALLAAGARCCRSPARIRTAHLRPRSTSSTSCSTRADGSRCTWEEATISKSYRLRRDASEQVEIDYYSFTRDEMTTRIVDPWRVFHTFGAWYLAAWCHRANAERLFRVDRVRAVRPTGEHFEEPELATSESGERAADAAELVYRPRPEHLRVSLRLAPSADWVVESFPHEAAEHSADGSWRVTLTVSETAWLERLLLALGPDVAVEGPPEAARVAPDAAARILRRYR